MWEDSVHSEQCDCWMSDLRASSAVSASVLPLGFYFEFLPRFNSMTAVNCKLNETYTLQINV